MFSNVRCYEFHLAEVISSLGIGHAPWAVSSFLPQLLLLQRGRWGKWPLSLTHLGFGLNSFSSLLCNPRLIAEPSVLVTKERGGSLHSVIPPLSGTPVLLGLSASQFQVSLVPRSYASILSSVLYPSLQKKTHFSNVVYQKNLLQRALWWQIRVSLC